MRVATLLFAVSLAWHAWVGVRDILMDYIKPARACAWRWRWRCCWRSPATSAGRCRSSGDERGAAGAQVRCDRGGRGRLGHARGAGARARRPQGRGALQGVPDALAHGGGAGRHRRAARQLDRGQLALAHVRHRQGLRLPRRPGRDRVHVPARERGGGRARAHGHAVRPARERQDLPAALRRPHAGLRQRRRWRCAPAPRPTAPATPCCTRCTSRTCAPTRSSSSSGWRST